MTDEEMMRRAIALAREAAAEGEVPVGCVVTLGDRIVGQGRNRRETGKNALYHAELEAIGEACRTLGGWRLWQCTLYVTLEPCPMCAGAIVNARIPRVVFGAADPKNGCCGSVVNLFSLPFNHQPELTKGVLEEACSELLSGFFERLRLQRPRRRRWPGPGPQSETAEPGSCAVPGSCAEAAEPESCAEAAEPESCAEAAEPGSRRSP